MFGSYPLFTPRSGGGLANPMTTGGDIIYGGASGTPTRLANGSAGQVLTSQGSTNPPQWAAAPGNPTYTAQTLPYSVPSSNYIVSISGSAGDITLPTAVGATGSITLIHAGAHFVAYNILTTSGQTVDGIASGSYALYTNGETLTLVSNGSNWISTGHKTNVANTSFSFTIGAVTTPPTPANDAVLVGYWSRLGSKGRVYWRYSSAVATGAANGSGAYKWPLPTGMVAKTTENDSSATSNDSPMGQCGSGRQNRNGTPGTLTVQLYDSGFVTIYFTDATTNSVVVSSTDASLNGGGPRQYAFWAEFEVSGWQP